MRKTSGSNRALNLRLTLQGQNRQNASHTRRCGLRVGSFLPASGGHQNDPILISCACHVEGGIGTRQVSSTGASSGRSHQAHEHFHREGEEEGPCTPGRCEDGSGGGGGRTREVGKGRSLVARRRRSSEGVAAGRGKRDGLPGGPTHRPVQFCRRIGSVESMCRRNGTTSAPSCRIQAIARTGSARSPGLSLHQLSIWVGASRGLTIPAVEFHEGSVEPDAAVVVGWNALREVFRGWGIMAAQDLTTRLCQEGFPRCAVGNHISARAQEHILRQACEVDARVALLEVMYVLITVHLGRLLAVPDVASMTVPMLPPPVRSVEITGATWEFLDQVDLGRRFSATHSCFEAVSSFSQWKIEVLFFRGFARTPSCALGKGSCGRESGLEAFRSGAHHALAHPDTQEVWVGTSCATEQTSSSEASGQIC